MVRCPTTATRKKRYAPSNPPAEDSAASWNNSRISAATYPQIPPTSHKFVVAEITTTIRYIAIEVPLGPREGLSKKCVANLDNLRTISREALMELIGTLGSARHVEVKRALGYAFAWDELIDFGQ